MKPKFASQTLRALPFALLSLVVLAVSTGDAVAPAFTVASGASLSQPVVARAADGSFAVAWRNGAAIVAKTYDSQSRVGRAEFTVNDSSNDASDGPAIAMNASGEFVVAWLRNGTVFARRYGIDGSALTPEVAGSLGGTGIAAATEPVVAIAGNGDFLLAWHAFDFSPADTSNNIYGRRFSANGTAQTGDLSVNLFRPNSQEDVSASLADDGSGVIAWTSFDQSSPGGDVMQRRIAADGTLAASESPLNTANSPSNETRPGVALASDGTLCAGWQVQSNSGTQIALRRFDASNAPVAAEVLASSGSDSKSSVAVAADARGNCLVSYASGDGSAAATLYARQFDRQQSPLSMPLALTGAGLPGGVGSDADGDGVAVWLESGGVQARRLVGPEAVDLAVTLTADNAFARPGSRLSYTAIVSNLHAVDASNNAIGNSDGLTLIVPTPASTSRAAITADSAWDCAASTPARLSCTRLSPLAAGTSASLSLDLVLPAQTTSVNTMAGVAGLQVDANSSNNSDSSTVTVRNPTLQLTALGTAQAMLAESGPGTTLEVTVNPASDSALSVPLSFTGSALTSDYSVSTGSTLSIPANSTRATFTLRPINDSTDEDDESLTVSLGAANGALLGTPVSQQLSIIDDDLAPTAAFSLSAVSISENSGSFEAVVRLSAASGRQITLGFGTTGGVTEGNDYSLNIPSPLVIPAGQTEGRIPVSIVNDTLDEDSEDLILTLTAPVNATLVQPSALTATIADNDPTPTLGFDISSLSLREGAAAGSLVLTLAAVSGRDVSGSLTLGGTATQGSDYSVSPIPFSIAAGQTSTTISVSALDDSSDEANETVTLLLANLVNTTARSGASSATVTLIDRKDPTLQFTALTAAQARLAENGSSVTVEVTVSPPSSTVLSVPINISGSASPEDYNISTGAQLSIPANATRRSFTVTAVDDSLDENDEALQLTLGDTSGAVVGTPATQTLSVIDNDAPPTIAFASSGQRVNENVPSFEAVLTLSAASSNNITINVSDSGSATSGSDYVLGSGTTLTIPAGQTTARLPVTLLDDGLDELNETLQLTLSSAVNATLTSPSVFAATIIDDDPAPSIAFETTGLSVREGAAASTLNLRLSAASSRDVSGTLTLDGDATRGADYSLSGTQFLIPAGQTSTAVMVTALADTLDEADEILSLSLANLINALPANGADQAVVRLIDANPPNVQFALASSRASEADGALSITVTLSSPADSELLLPFTLSGEADSSDATVTGSPLRIAAGASSGSISVNLRDDSANEPEERLILTLSDTSGATVVSPSQHVLSIADNDPIPMVRLASSTLTVAEGSTGTVRILLSAASDRTVRATLAVVAGGTADADDYGLADTAISFAPGVTELLLPLLARSDSLAEGSETLALQLSAPVNASLASPTQLVATLTDPSASPSGGPSGGGLVGGVTVTKNDGGGLGLYALLPLLLAAMGRCWRSRSG